MSLRKKMLFLPESLSVTKEDFDALPKKARFIFGFGNKNSGGWNGQFSIEGKDKQIAIEFGFDARKELPSESLVFFRVEDNGQRLVYPPTSVQIKPKEVKSREDGSYYIGGLSPLETGADKNKIKRMSADELVGEIRKASGRGLIIYTGAGVSMAGERPVWGMKQLKNELGVDENGETFAQVFKNPQKHNPEDVLAKVDEFSQQLFADFSTSAHVAIAEIVKEKPGTIIFTENLDYKHEADGSRIKAYRLGSGEEIMTKINLRVSEAKVLIVAGLRRDDRGFIHYLKKQNPGIKVFAFVFSEETIPKYLSETDGVILGDVQETLPAVSQSLRQN